MLKMQLREGNEVKVLPMNNFPLTKVGGVELIILMGTEDTLNNTLQSALNTCSGEGSMGHLPQVREDKWGKRGVIIVKNKLYYGGTQWKKLLEMFLMSMARLWAYENFKLPLKNGAKRIRSFNIYKSMRIFKNKLSKPKESFRVLQRKYRMENSHK